MNIEWFVIIRKYVAIFCHFPKANDIELRENFKILLHANFPIRLRDRNKSEEIFQSW